MKRSLLLFLSVNMINSLSGQTTDQKKKIPKRLQKLQLKIY